MENTIFKEFFRSVSYKFRKENDLSDITWAMCQSCETFRNTFLKFFFPEIQIDGNVYIEREKSEEDSRPDFFIENGGVIYLIENKIYDTNHHFGQYDVTFNIAPSKFGYITNYCIDDEVIRKKGYRLHTWEELYNSFSKILTDNTEEVQLWHGYLEYVKNVCGIIKIEEPMKLDGIYSLFSLMEIIEKKLTNRKEDLFEVKLYNSNKLCGNGYSNGATGVNFELIYKHVQGENTPQIWGWIGIYYDTINPKIMMGFYNKSGWGKGYIDMLNNKELSKQYSFEKPYKEDSCLWFEMSKKLRSDFEECEDVTKQEAILKQFMDDVILYPLK